MHMLQSSHLSVIPQKECQHFTEVPLFQEIENLLAAAINSELD